MRVSIIGSGNVANVLGRLFLMHGHTILHVAGRNSDQVSELATAMNAHVVDLEQMKKSEADLCMIAVSDQAIESVLRSTGPFQLPLFHTAGSVSCAVLKNYAELSGVIYPLQTLRKEADAIPDIPFLVDGNNEFSKQFILDFIGTLSSKVKLADDDERFRIHIAAVFANNFVNHLYAIAEDICRQENLDFNFLKPLILETASKVMLKSPTDVQTGPAIRGDHQTMERHLSFLNEYPKYRQVYIALSESIIQSKPT